VSLDYVPVGIDMSGFWFDVHVLGGKGKEARFANSPEGFQQLLQFLEGLSVHVCIEGTGGYERKLCVFLVQSGILVSRVNSLLVRRFAEGLGLSHKTDRIDARVLAEYCRIQRPAAMQIEKDSRRELRQLVRTLKDLKNEQRQMRGRQRSPLLPESAKQALMLADHGLSLAIDKLQGEIDRVLEADAELAEDLALLSSIKGVAKNSALLILAYLPEGALLSARGLANYAGVIPSLRESGARVRSKPTIPSRCSHELRAVLFMCGMVARQYCPHLKAFALKLLASGKAKKQAIVAVMRKLTHAIFAVLTTRQNYDGAKLCPNT
jgi:transposase